MKTNFKLQKGDHVEITNPELHITGTGPRTYIWIGEPGCVGTLSGAKTLRQLASNILAALDKSTILKGK